MCCNLVIMWIQMEAAGRPVSLRNGPVFCHKPRRTPRLSDFKTCGSCNYGRNVHSRENYTIDGDIWGGGDMQHFFSLSLSPLRCGWMVHVRDGVSATHSLYLCFCKESDLVIAKPCHSPWWFSCHRGLFMFLELGGGE